MTVKSFRELICWQLSVELRRGVLAFIATSPIRHDRDYCQQIRKSSRSPGANIAEGFGRSDAIFRRHLDIALGSAADRLKRYLTP
jgi:four helix bundle protein